MPKTLSAGMKTMLSSNSHTRCWMILLICLNGSRVGLTTHNAPITFNLDGAGDVVYQPSRGLVLSDISTAIGFDTGNTDIKGAFTTDFTLEDYASGIYHRAKVFIFQVDWTNLANGYIPILAGTVAEAKASYTSFTVEMRDNKDWFNQTIGKLITNLCSADYGNQSTGCYATVETLDTTIASVTDELQLSVTYAGGGFPDDYFNVGRLTFTSGILVGGRSLSIFDWTAIGGHIVLRNPLPALPSIGDSVTLSRGCPKTRQGCKDRGQILNARAFFEVPSSDALTYPVPSSN